MSAPSIEIDAPPTIGDQDAILLGGITSAGGKPIIDCGFYCDRNASPSRQYHANVVQYGPFTYKIVGLLPGTTYYFKSFATNADGYSTSAVLSFTTTGTSRGQVLVWAADGGEESYDFTGEIADVGSIHLEFEENTGEFSSGDCSFSVQNDGAALYALLLTGRQFRVQITTGDNILPKFLGDLQIENTVWDPDKLRYTFYALQETKGFIDQASAVPLAPTYGNISALPTDPNPTQTTDEVGDIITSSLAALSSYQPYSWLPAGFQQAFGGVLYEPEVDLSDSSIANDTIAHKAYWYRPDGSAAWGNIGFFGMDYGYMLRDFLVDVCTQWGGAYWIDNAGKLQIRQRNIAWQTLSDLDGHISGFKVKFRNPWYDVVAINRSVYFSVPPATRWILYTKDDGFIYPIGHLVDGIDHWDSFSDMGGQAKGESDNLYRPYTIFLMDKTYTPDGNNYTISNMSELTGVIAPVGSALDVNLPSKYSSVGHALGDYQIKPIFFPAINSATDIRAKFKAMVTPVEEATIEFDEIVHVEPFWGVTAYGDVYIAHTIDYDLPDRKTTVVGNKVVS